MDELDGLVQQLDAFDPDTRRQALVALILAQARSFRPVGSNVNMHFHSFFSFNAEEWSPSRIAWESRRAGLYAAGLCDFDVLDGLDEFVQGGQLLGLRTAVHLETRVFLREFASVDITSPGEPGVTYIMGAGFARPLPAGTPQAAGLAAFREQARARNLALLERINPALPEIALDYERDVVPLTPAGGATERHIVRAYANKARLVFGTDAATADFWAKALKKQPAEALALLGNTPALEEAVRSRLVKRGGIGYEQPSETTFPAADAFTRWVLDCEAIPMITWLDGTSGGEQDPAALLECLCAKGAAAINIIPDRNWNIAKPAERELKIARLNEIVAVSDRMGLPINIGTEMNKLGLPFADNLDGEALAPHKAAFLRGARIMVGHANLLRYASYSYTGAAAAADFKTVAARNDFFERVGQLPPLAMAQGMALDDMDAAEALTWFRDAVR